MPGKTTTLGSACAGAVGTRTARIGAATAASTGSHRRRTIASESSAVKGVHGTGELREQPLGGGLLTCPSRGIPATLQRRRIAARSIGQRRENDGGPDHSARATRYRSTKGSSAPGRDGS